MFLRVRFAKRIFKSVILSLSGKTFNFVYIEVTCIIKQVFEVEYNDPAAGLQFIQMNFLCKIIF